MSSKNKRKAQEKTSIIKRVVIPADIALDLIARPSQIQEVYSYYQPYALAIYEVAQQVSAVEWEPVPIGQLPKHEKYHSETALVVSGSTNTNTAVSVSFSQSPWRNG